MLINTEYWIFQCWMFKKPWFPNLRVGVAPPGLFLESNVCILGRNVDIDVILKPCNVSLAMHGWFRPSIVATFRFEIATERSRLLMAVGWWVQSVGYTTWVPYHGIPLDLGYTWAIVEVMAVAFAGSPANRRAASGGNASRRKLTRLQWLGTGRGQLRRLSRFNLTRSRHRTPKCFLEWVLQLTVRRWNFKTGWNGDLYSVSIHVVPLARCFPQL